MSEDNKPIDLTGHDCPDSQEWRVVTAPLYFGQNPSQEFGSDTFPSEHLLFLDDPPTGYPNLPVVTGTAAMADQKGTHHRLPICSMDENTGIVSTETMLLELPNGGQPQASVHGLDHTDIWTCRNHPPGLEVSVPKGEKCSVCQREER